MRRILKIITILFISTVFLSGCEKAAPKGRIRVKNDSRDSTYNVVNVSGGGAAYRLEPGESAIMPKGTTTLYWSRAYKDYTRSYQVSCPRLSDKDSGITMKMIDVHLNRIAGGCSTTYASKN
jgi:hypothetical protein